MLGFFWLVFFSSASPKIFLLFSDMPASLVQYAMSDWVDVFRRQCDAVICQLQKRKHREYAITLLNTINEP